MAKKIIAAGSVRKGQALIRRTDLINSQRSIYTLPDRIIEALTFGSPGGYDSWILNDPLMDEYLLGWEAQ